MIGISQKWKPNCQSLIAVVAYILMSVCATGRAQPVAARKPERRILRRLRVCYVTNRSAEKKTGNALPLFGARPGPLTIGTADVVIEKGFDITTCKGIAICKRKRLKSVKAIPAAKGGPKDVLIFVHGYYVGFEESIQRVAQIAHTYDFRGTIVVFTWPSLCQFSPKAYFQDRKALDASVKAFQKFLEDAVGRFGANRIHLLAHSLGCRLVCKTLDKMTAANGGKAPFRLKNVLLASPDVDVATFGNRFCAPLAQAAQRVTIYHSRSDRLLWFAKLFNDNRNRLGRSGAVKSKGIEVIDFTALGGPSTAHNFYREHPAMVRDICAVIAGLTSPCHRQLLAVRP